MANSILDGNWDGVFDGFFTNPGRTGQIMLQAEQVKALQLKRAREEDELRAVREIIKRQNAGFDAMNPPATEIPMPPSFSFEAGGRGGVPFTPGNMGGGASVTAAPPLRLENMPRSWGVDEPFYRDRETARSRQNLAPYLAKDPKDVAQLSGLDALTQLQLYGLPQGKPLQDIMETQLGTVSTKLPGYGGTQPAVHNYAATDPATGQTSTFRSVDGRTDLATGKPLPPNALIAGPADLTSKSPFATADSAKAELAQSPLAAKARSGVHLTTDETERLGLLIDRAYPETLVTVDENGRKVVRRERKDVIPVEHDRLVKLLDEFRSGVHLQQPQQPFTPPPPMQATAPVPGVPSRAVPQIGVVDPNVDPAEVPEPIVPEPRGRPTGTGVSEPVFTGPINAQSLSDNFRAEPIYKTYTTVLQTWNTLARYAEGGFDGTYNNGTDLAIIYHIAKLFDPDSAVREGELTLTRNIGPIGDTLVAMYRQKFLDAGILPAKVRADLLRAGKIKMEEVSEVANGVFGTYRGRAERGSVHPDDVVPTLPPPRPFDYRAVLERGQRTDQSVTQPPQQPPTQTGPRINSVPTRPPWETP